MPAVAPRRRAATLYDSICMFVQENFQLPLTRNAVAAYFRVPRFASLKFRSKVVSLLVFQPKWIASSRLESPELLEFAPQNLNCARSTGARIREGISRTHAVGRPISTGEPRTKGCSAGQQNVLRTGCWTHAKTKPLRRTGSTRINCMIPDRSTRLVHGQPTRPEERRGWV
mgnify:CR=1 FL=1